jgi:hypothetical protein
MRHENANSAGTAPHSGRALSPVQKLFDVITRIFCGYVGYFAAMFALAWGVSNLASIASGNPRDMLAGLVGMVFTALAALLATVCIRRTLGFGPLFKKSAPKAAPFISPVQLSDRHQIRAQTWRVVMMACMGAALLLMAIAILPTATGDEFYVPGAMLALGLVMAASATRILMNDNVVASYDAQGVSIPGLFGEQRFSWHEIEAIKIMKRTLYVYHFIPMRSIYHVYIEVPGRVFAKRKVYLPLSLTGYKKEDMAVLQMNLEQQRSFGRGDPTMFQSRMNVASPQPYHQSGSSRSAVQSFGKRTH